MKKSFDSQRRVILKSAGAAAILAIAPAVSIAATATHSKGDASGSAIQVAQLFHVQIRSNLYDDPVRMDVQPGVLSKVVALPGRGDLRVKVTPAGADKAFGPYYHLELTNAEGKVLDSMNVGSNTTATFSALGIQVYLVSFGASA